MLKGWGQISEFLGEPQSVERRWASEGSLCKRKVDSSRLYCQCPQRWLGRESGKPVQRELAFLQAGRGSGLFFRRILEIPVSNSAVKSVVSVAACAATSVRQVLRADG